MLELRRPISETRQQELTKQIIKEEVASNNFGNPAEMLKQSLNKKQGTESEERLEKLMSEGS